MPTDHGFRQGHPGGVHLRRESHAYPAAQPRKGTLGRLVDQSDRPAIDVLELHVEGVRMVPEAQHRLQGGCCLTIVWRSCISTQELDPADVGDRELALN